MTKIKNIDKLFHGTEELAKAILEETENIRVSTEEISKLLNDEFND